MKALALLLCLALLGGAAATALGVGPLAGEDLGGELSEFDLGDLGLPGAGSLSSAGLSGGGCEGLAVVTDEIAAETQDPVGLLRRLGRRAAGIHDPPRAFVDLARGGQDLIPGAGFLGRFDDGSAGQARHFAGVAVASTYGNRETTRLVSIFLRRDPADSADGELTDAALEFARLLRSGELPADQAGEWILAELCRSPA